MASSSALAEFIPERNADRPLSSANWSDEPGDLGIGSALPQRWTEPTNVRAALAHIRAWGEHREWRGNDPYEGLNSPLAPVLSLGSALGRRVVTQAVKRTPVNIRPLLGIRPGWNAKAIGLVASAYARLAAADGDDTARAEGIRWLSWLMDRHHGGTEGVAWGYHFAIQTRTSRIARDTPNTVATAFVSHALLDGYELLGDERCAEWARDAAHRLVETSFAKEARNPYFRYHATESKLVHNANMLGCGMLARTARVLDAQELLEPAARATATTVRAQRADGAWLYADEPGHRWIDNFHTGYVLESLAECERTLSGWREPLERGIAFWERELFLSDGTPKHFIDRALPHDAHSYATAIDTWLAVTDWRADAVERAALIAELLIERLLAPSGYVYVRRGRFGPNRVPLVRWSTAPAFRALATLRLKRRSSPSADLIPSATNVLFETQLGER